MRSEGAKVTSAVQPESLVQKGTEANVKLLTRLRFKLNVL